MGECFCRGGPDCCMNHYWNSWETFPIYPNSPPVTFIQQGWQCPVCKAVMAPNFLYCINCTGKKDTSGTETK